MAISNPTVSDSSSWDAVANTAEAPCSVLLICVKYGADKETSQYLQSVRHLHRQTCLRVLVIDNKADGDPEASSTEGYPTIKPGKNLGYFGGARHALSIYLETNPLPDWIIISNSDLAIPDPAFLDRLTAAALIPELGALAPSIRSGLTGGDQNPFMRTRPMAIRMHFYKYLYRSWLLLNMYELTGALSHKMGNTLRSLTRNSSEPARRSQETIYAPHGSFLILSKQYFSAGGDLQYPEFLFGEEIYIAEMIRRLGMKVIYDPSLTVLHEEHQSTRLFRSRKMAAYASSSAAYCANTFFPLRHLSNQAACTSTSEGD